MSPCAALATASTVNMFHRIRWQFVLGYLLLVFLTTMVTLWRVSRPVCVADVTCVQLTVVVAALCLVVLGLLLTWWAVANTIRPLRQLTQVARRLADGDSQARMLLPEPDDLGDLVRAFHDVTERFSQQIATLTGQQQQLELVLTYMADGLLIVDFQGYVRLINPSASQLLRTTVKQALYHSFAEVARNHQLIDLLHQCQQEERQQVQAVEIGRDRFWQVTITPFQERDRHDYLIILHDLTYIRRLESVRRDFVSNVSHELRTPLTSLRAVVETLQDGALEDPAVAERFLQRAVHEVDTLTQMVEELLELSRIESGQVPLRLAATAVSALIALPLERLGSQAEWANLQITVQLPETLPMVLADAPRIQQVVTNLLHNAIKFTPPQGQIMITAHPGVSVTPPDMVALLEDTVVIEVRDNGIGIAHDDLPRIFERFYKSDRARTRGQAGTGLGLAIARHLVEAHKGHIWVKSKEGKGSAFYFSLPVAHN